MELVPPQGTPASRVSWLIQSVAANQRLGIASQLYRISKSVRPTSPIHTPRLCTSSPLKTPPHNASTLIHNGSHSIFAGAFARRSTHLQRYPRSLQHRRSQGRFQPGLASLPEPILQARPDQRYHQDSRFLPLQKQARILQQLVDAVLHGRNYGCFDRRRREGHRSGYVQALDGIERTIGPGRRIEESA